MQGVVPYPEEDAKKYKRLRLWRDITMGEALDWIAKIYPDREALIDESKRLTYEELLQSANRLALALIEVGLKPGDKVIMQLPNVVEYGIVYLALQKMGAVPILSITRHAYVEIEHFARMAEAVAWIGPPQYGKIDYLEMLKKLRSELPSLKHIILVDEGSREKPGTISYHKLLSQFKKYDPEALKAFRPDPDEPCLFGPTAGTTGIPKLVPRTHNSFLCTSYFGATCFDKSARDISLVVTPLSHPMALHQFSGLFITGGKLVLSSSTKISDMLPIIQKERISRPYLVPTLLVDLLREPGLEKYDLSSVIELISGGAKTPVELLKEIKRRLNLYVINGFGMTEGARLSARWYWNEEEIFNTVGKPFCPWDDFKILDEEGKELPQGEEGLLAAKGPCIFTGYYKAEQLNKQSFTPQGYFLTGDLAKINKKGNFIITGRTKDVINRGGEKISAVEVEELLLTIEGVVAAAAVPMPDARMGEKVCAFIQPAEGYTFNLETITGKLKAKGASVLLLPERLELLQDMPLTPMGKIDKKILRQRLEI